MYLCCRVTHKEGAGLLYAPLGLYIRIESTRYVRLLRPYLSAANSMHIDISLVLSRNVLKYPISGYQWSLSYISYSLIICKSHVSYSWSMFQTLKQGYVPMFPIVIILMPLVHRLLSKGSHGVMILIMLCWQVIHMVLTHWLMIQSFQQCYVSKFKVMLRRSKYQS